MKMPRSSALPEITVQGLLGLLGLLAPPALQAQEGTDAETVRAIPAHTAYLTPDHNGARVSGNGISRWRGGDLAIVWHGLFRESGTIECAVDLNLREGQEASLKLEVAGQTREATATGSATRAEFGEFAIKEPGYVSLTLRMPEPKGRRASATVKALLLNGEPAASAHFNMKERRNAASVHLSYPVPRGTDVAAFYCEVTALEDPIHTYYMATGWHRGYFGMQVNSETERRIIFSVWDSGNEAIDRDKVADENRVRLLGKGEDVHARDFGNEGTGGHSHLKYMWKTGEIQRFLVTAQPLDGDITIYAGYYFHPEKDEWMLISSWKAPHDGSWLRGLYSFSENFWDGTGHLLRKARFGNQWILTADGEWRELTTATFSHDATGRQDRPDRFMGLENGDFFLSHGGFIDGFTEYRKPFDRPIVGKAPDIELPEVEGVPGLRE